MLYTIITGSTSGLGKELAYLFANKGHDLILIARRYKILESIKNDLEAKYGVLVVCIECDLDDIESVNSTFSKINDNYQINCIINNAGIGNFEKIEDISLNSLLQQNNVNFISPVITTKLLIDNIIKNNGSIINICSILSYIPNIKSSIYVANKHALLGFSNCIRLEYPKLHVLTVHPATIKTNFFKDDSYFKKVKTVLNPSIVANKIYKYYKLRKRRLNIPKTIFILNLIYNIFPNFIDKINYKYFSNK